MFYCEPCGEEKGWAGNVMGALSHGRCELCGKFTACHDVPSHMLPKFDREPIGDDSPDRRHAQAEVPADGACDKRDRGKMIKPEPGAPAGGYKPTLLALSALNLKPGDKIRPIRDASGKPIKDGKVWIFCRFGPDEMAFGKSSPSSRVEEGILLASSYGWEVVERAEKLAEEYKGLPDDVTVGWTTPQNFKSTVHIERIVAAAVQIEGITISLPKPARHGTILACTSYSLNMEPGRELQGFLTSTGRFVNRIQARHIADIAGQKPGRSGGRDNPELFSEDLW